MVENDKTKKESNLETEKSIISILNLGAGRMETPFVDKEVRVNVDRCYEDIPDCVPDLIDLCLKHNVVENGKAKINRVLYYNSDIFEFLEKYPKKFYKIELYRVLEHIPRDKVMYLIYLMADVLKEGGIVDVICPDYKKLAQMILDPLPSNSEDYEKKEILLYTELFNEPSDPHCFITTQQRLMRVFTLENRFKTISCNDLTYFENRDIYFQMKFKRLSRY
jgi:hypothetical protein